MNSNDSALTHLDVYRHLHRRPGAYNAAMLDPYIQHYGLYPIGSLVKFSGGFIACVEELTPKGHIRSVRVLKNLQHPDINLDSPLSGEDLGLIGKVEQEEDPRNHRVAI